jgi:hypothetical protein
MLLRQIIFEKLFAVPAGTHFDVRNTLFFKILRVNPLLARFYADLFRRHGANPSLIKDLENLSPKFFSPDPSTPSPTPQPSKGVPMALNPNTRSCSHIKVNGLRCGSPSLRGEVFCYFHQRMIRGVRTPPKSRLHPLANFEDAEAIQASLMEVVNALVRNHIDVARARLILRALSIASTNAKRARFDWSKDEMVKEVPEYPAAPPVTGSFAIATAQAAALATVSSPPEEESEAERLISAFQPAPADVPRKARRKPPSGVRMARRSRPRSGSRAG